MSHALTSPGLGLANLELIGLEQRFPLLGRDQGLHVLPGHVDAIVEVSAPEHVVVTHERSSLKARS